MFKKENSTKWYFKDRAEARAWIDFRDSIAEFSIQCRRCNVAAGDGGYRAGKRQRTQ